jgi:hypothetical protein
VVEPGFRAVRANLRPFLAIQACALCLLAAYYASPTFQRAGEPLTRFKESAGLAFSAASTMFAGYALPWLAKRAAGIRFQDDAREIALQCSLFALLGAIVDLWYRGLALVIGAGTGPGIVAVKVLADQFVFSPLVSIPISTAVFGWRDAGFSFSRARCLLTGGGFASRYWPLLVTCWCFWLPILCVVFALPVGLQFWMFLCAQGAWSLLLVHINRRDA